MLTVQVRSMSKRVLLVTACAMILVVVFFEFYVFRIQRVTLTVQAYNDASYSVGSKKWEFLYEPSFGSNFDSNPSFPFDYFSINPGELNIHGGKPTLTIGCVSNVTTAYGNGIRIDGLLLNANAGASINLDGIEITVVEANSSDAMLMLKPSPE